MERTRRIKRLARRALVCVLAAVLLGNSFVACADKALKVPEGVRIENDLLLWEAVEGADAYLVTEGERTWRVEGTSLDIFELAPLPDTDYSFTVEALGDGDKQKDSKPSLPVVYRYPSCEGVGFRPIESNSLYYEAYAEDPDCIKGKIYIPSVYGEHAVTDVAQEGFVNCNELSAVILADGIEAVEESAFSRCTMLSRIRLPESLISVGNGAFSGCSALNSLHFGKHIMSIGFMLCADCISLRSLTVEKTNPYYMDIGNCIVSTIDRTLLLGCRNSVFPSEGVETIAGGAFYGCSPEVLILPEGVRRIGTVAFYDSQIKYIEFPSTLDALGDRAFALSALEAAVFRGSLAEIPEKAFQYCATLRSVTFPLGLVTVGAYAFSDCDLEEISLAEGLESIGVCAFSGNERVGQVVIPRTVKAIGGNAFLGVRHDTQFLLPDEVETIGKGAFGGVLYTEQGNGGLYLAASYIAYDAVFGYDGKTPYVESIQKIKTPINSGGQVLDIPVPKRDGYAFLGWSFSDGGEVAISPTLKHERDSCYYVCFTWEDFANMPAEKTTYYAVWEKIAI